MNIHDETVRVVNFRPLHPIETFGNCEAAKSFLGLNYEYFQLKAGISIELVKFKNKYYIVETK